MFYARTQMSTAGRFDVLDSWRGIASLCVALFHVDFNFFLFDSQFIRHSQLFVDFFFVLSGFVICGAYSAKIFDAKTALRYFIRRFGRLWPLHICILVLFLVLEAAKLVVQTRYHIPGQEAFTAPYFLSALLPNALLLHAVGFENSVTWNTPSWSISVELWVCVFFAAVCLATRTKRFLAFLTIYVCVLIWAALNLDDGWSAYQVARGVAGFFLGAAIRQAHAILPRTHHLLATALEGGAVGLVIAVIYLFPPTLFPGYATPAFAVLVAVFAGETGAISSLLKARPFRFLGSVSYSIYLTHEFLLVLMGRFMNLLTHGGLQTRTIKIADLTVVERMIDNTALANLLVVGFVLSLLGVSAITYRYLEVPWRTRFNRLSGNL